jgi:hypothetical protein
MKRKVKFQAGGTVDEPAPRRSRRESARNRQLRETMEKFGREGRRVRTSERLQEDATTRRNTARSAGPPNFTTDPEGTTRRGADTGRSVAVRPEAPPPATRSTGEVGMPRSAGSQAVTNAPRQIPLGPVSGAAARGASRLVPVLGTLASFEPTSLEGGAAFERENFQRAAAENLMRNMPERPDIPTEMRNAMPERPNVEVERRAARRPAPAPRRELTMEEIRALVSGAREPRTSEERALRDGLRMSEADRLNERELRRIQAARAAEEEAARQMGGSGDIGAASARARGEQVGPPGDYNMKKGGIVKKKAGGMIAAKPKAAPKKMMKGGMVAKPKVAASKAKPKAMPKAMPFKKGGMIKKGKK